MRKHLASTPSTFRALLSLVDSRPTSRSTQPVYVVGQWVRDRGAMSQEEWEERLDLGEMIAGWTMNVLEDILSEGTLSSLVYISCSPSDVLNLDERPYR